MQNKKLKTGGIVIPEKINIVEYLENKIASMNRMLNPDEAMFYSKIKNEKIKAVLDFFNDLLSKIKSGEIVIKEKQEYCVWHEDGDYDYGNGKSYKTDCGEEFTTIDGMAKQNGIKYCNYCGRERVSEKYYKSLVMTKKKGE